jgi:hypothetical protein
MKVAVLLVLVLLAPRRRQVDAAGGRWYYVRVALAGPVRP